MPATSLPFQENPNACSRAAAVMISHQITFRNKAGIWYQLKNQRLLPFGSAVSPGAQVLKPRSSRLPGAVKTVRPLGHLRGGDSGAPAPSSSSLCHVLAETQGFCHIRPSHVLCRLTTVSPKLWATQASTEPPK